MKLRDQYDRAEIGLGISVIAIWFFGVGITLSFPYTLITVLMHYVSGFSIGFWGIFGPIIISVTGMVITIIIGVTLAIIQYMKES